uniref:Uncharacterized protein n=1 Tax=Chromera velia CCMP2878 TaxID=1169474 RepID=A0A0G4I9V6_9ALVE|eukprot:Cvel_12386.t1-p1 / transcript=Cvel_12386.t1 / gene=Cvel_12386 / organism=Chromera_velia_CCMP2878 / gene_product=hypothetical protein / transcript_product=hypothetical protein / location=Cvel_scaffold809:25286-28652(-) / protein_length=229 / sequence_SO=supercontig / SO=protein_coding / is_pseudo=false
MGNQPTAVQAPPGLQGEAAFKQYPLNQSEELKTQQNTNVLRDPTQPVSPHSSKQASRLARSDTTDVHQRRTSALRFGPFRKQNSMGNQPTAVQAPPGLQGEAAFKQYPLNQSEELKTQQNTNVLRDPTQPVSPHSSKQASRLAKRARGALHRWLPRCGLRAQVAREEGEEMEGREGLREAEGPATLRASGSTAPSAGKTKPACSQGPYFLLCQWLHGAVSLQRLGGDAR